MRNLAARAAFLLEKHCPVKYNQEYMWQKIKNIYHLLQAFTAAVFFRFPSKDLVIIGVTGTDGKTTTVNMIYHILKEDGKRVSMVSSVGAKIGSSDTDTGFHVSTPSSWNVQRLINNAKSAGSEFFVMEATSHGLDQNRLAFVNFTVAVLTNITSEHMDYHKNFPNYVSAKSKLFKNVKFSVLNVDDKSYNAVKKNADGKVISYSLKNKGDYNLKNLPLSLTVPGDYNLHNALAASSACIALGLSKQQVTKSLKTFAGVTGRMQEVKLGQDFKVFIDFAHTPNSLGKVLTHLNSTKSQGEKLVAVFGAAGQRDRTKRKTMGEVADKIADVIVLTSEDPRDEDPEEIAKEIAAGIKNKKMGKDLFIVKDRKEAIEKAVDLVKPGDIIGIFGKGHEKSFSVGGHELPWDDVEIASEIIKRKIK
ncbi:MAG: UDP-N-acetylmuramoyl-L-alanyl-D-glutamate--2,6-diaminopimelate ligase [Candidatus Curtissbacteria bacterium]|nr:UDP-N-acetylmuramoyl-L-alanyl-D-glutamate--2,6-diaminopimelate ligase [Candidatus Curtissbacteria bacterium]